MKYALLAVLIVAAGCGSKNVSTSHHVQTRTVEDTSTNQACQSVIQELLQSVNEMRKGAKVYASQIMPAYTAGVYGNGVGSITNRMNAATAHVRLSTQYIQTAEGLLDQCMGR